MLNLDVRRLAYRATIIAALLVLPVFCSAKPGGEFDISQGHVDGLKAVAIRVVEGIGSRELIDPSGFVVQLVPATDLDTVLTQPAGEWFVPQSGKYKFWVEGPGWMTPYSAIFTYHRQPFKDKGSAAVVPVEPAGTVVLADDVATSPSTILRLLHLDSHNRAPYPQRELSRSVRASAMGQGAQMPEGLVVAGLFDSRTRDYLALSRPFEVKHKRRVAIRPAPPRSPLSDLLVRLERPEFILDHAQFGVEIIARGEDGKSRKPDVVIRVTDRLYAIWYALGEARVSLEVRSASVYLPPETIVLRPGRVENFRGALQPLPDVDVRLELPDSFSATEKLLEVTSGRPDAKVLREIELPINASSFLLEDIVAAPVEILLHAAPWSFQRTVDLSDGQDATVIFDPTPLTVTGTVYRGGHGHSATVEFQTPSRRVTIPFKTDQAGSYEAQLFAIGLFLVSVRLDGLDAVAHRELLGRPLREDASLDFLIPDNRFAVRVVDAETREGIESAELSVGNRYHSMGGPLRVSDSESQSQTVLRVLTDRDGVAKLRPLHPGMVTLQAKAEGYMPSVGIEEPVEKDEPGREITIAMRPSENSTKLRLLLPDGRFAAGADVRVQASLGNTRPRWSGSADGEGFVELPLDATQGWVLATHPDGGYLIRRSLPAYSDDVSWTLSAAMTPLAVAVKRPWGEAAKWANVALWIDGRCVFGHTLAWLAGASIATDGKGFWTAQNLPAAPLKILAWSREYEVNPLALEALADNVSYPRQDVVAVATLN